MKTSKPFIGLIFFFLLTNVLSLKGQTTKALIETEYGNITIMLYDGTPVHRDNFVKLVEDGFYDGLLFHRVIKGFMIQGGDPNSKDAASGAALGSGNPGYTLPAEILPTYFHKKGALCAARTGDRSNPQRRSSGSQFYLVQGQVYTQEQLKAFEQRLHTTFTEAQREAYTTIGGTPHLDAQYTVFGEVIEGMDVIDKIATLQTDKRDRPVKDVKMKIEILK